MYKVMVKFSLRKILRRMGLEVCLHSFLTSSLDYEEWLASHSCRFSARETAER